MFDLIEKDVYVQYINSCHRVNIRFPGVKPFLLITITTCMRIEYLFFPDYYYETGIMKHGYVKVSNGC